MFTKWSKKEVLTFFICFAVFFALVLVTQLPGFASPLYWAMFPALSAFVAAGPLTCVMNMKRGFGSAAAIPLLWFILYRCLGELGMPLMWVWMFAVMVIAEIVRACIGYDKKVSIRAAVPIASLVPFGNLIPMYFTKQAFLARALEEMDPEYVAGLDRYGTIWMFLIVLALAIFLSIISERISERILKK